MAFNANVCIDWRSLSLADLDQLATDLQAEVEFRKMERDKLRNSDAVRQFKTPILRVVDSEDNGTYEPGA